MERVRKNKLKPTLESIFFSTPEQRLLRYLLTEPTTVFSPRTLSSRLKGVRGLGGVDGIKKILEKLGELGIVVFLNNNREVHLNNDNSSVRLMKMFSAVCDLEGLQNQLEPLSDKGVLYGNRANGFCQSDSEYQIIVSTDQPEEVADIVEHHPLGRRIDVATWTPDDFHHIDQKNPGLAKKVSNGIVMWGAV